MVVNELWDRMSSGILLSDYKFALEQTRKYGVGVCPILSYNNLGNKTLKYLVFAKSPDLLVSFSKTIKVYINYTKFYPIRTKYFGMRLSILNSKKLTSILLGNGYSPQTKGLLKWGIHPPSFKRY